MKTIIFATSNSDKVREINEMTEGLEVNVLTLKDIGFEVEIDETGTTFTDNALIKAETVAGYAAVFPEWANAIVLADDSGLEIDYYDKAPGVYSHRWLGERTYHQAMSDVLKEMENVPDEKRGCRFVCAMAAVIPGQDNITVEGTVEGRVAYEIIGENGFGYDPFFYVPEYGCTTAQMTPEQKNQISHRGRALRAIIEKLSPYLK